MRGAGVGDGEGEGKGEGEAAGVWARTSSGNFETASPAAPIAGRSFTKLRLLTFTRDLLLFFFIIGSCHPGKSAANITSFCGV